MSSVSVTTHDFVVVSVQTVAFLADRILSPSRIMASVLKSYADRYDGEIQALPLPPDVPAELPRVILQSADQRFRFEAGPARISSIWQYQDDDREDLSSVTSRCREVLVHCLGELKPRVGRLALVITRARPTEHPAQILVEQFCNSNSQCEPFNRSSNFEIHNHKQYTPSQSDPKLTINSWVRCKTGTLTKNNSPAILVEQDLNTLAEDLERNRFDAASTTAFFDLTVQEADSILKKYFPGETSCP